MLALTEATWTSLFNCWYSCFQESKKRELPKYYLENCDWIDSIGFIKDKEKIRERELLLRFSLSSYFYILLFASEIPDGLGKANPATYILFIIRKPQPHLHVLRARLAHFFFGVHSVFIWRSQLALRACSYIHACNARRRTTIIWRRTEYYIDK